MLRLYIRTMARLYIRSSMSLDFFRGDFCYKKLLRYR